MSADIKPYRISVDDDVLHDLKSRLRNTRWPEAELVEDWSQGAPLKWIKDICRYWAEEYDWRGREARLNRFAQFTTEIDGLDIHFLHVRSPHPEAMPLVITHGWPGSVVEFHKVIEPLTDPTAHGGNAADAFHVVCPSLPGFGFSEKPKTTGWGVARIASSWAVLMDRLGYSRYVAQGGDWGSAVTTAIGAQDAEHCAGIHITLAMSARPNVEGQPTPEEAMRWATVNGYRALGIPDGGSIEAGNKADLIMVDFRRAHLVPRLRVVSTFVHQGQGRDVTDVMVDGAWLMRDGAVLTMDEDATVAEAQRVSETAWARLFAQRPDLRPIAGWQPMHAAVG